MITAGTSIASPFDASHGDATTSGSLDEMQANRACTPPGGLPPRRPKPGTTALEARQLLSEPNRSLLAPDGISIESRADLRHETGHVWVESFRRPICVIDRKPLSAVEFPGIRCETFQPASLQ